MKLITISIFFLNLLFQAFPLSAADKKDAYIAGKVYDEPQSQTLKGAAVRIVNLDTGEAHQTKTDGDGCYSFKKIQEGSYSLSVSWNGQDHLLAEKVKVEKNAEKDVVVSICTALASKSALVQLQNCQICSKVIPAWALIVAAGAGGIGVISAIIISDDPPASPSTP